MALRVVISPAYTPRDFLCKRFSIYIQGKSNKIEDRIPIPGGDSYGFVGIETSRATAARVAGILGCEVEEK